MSYVVGRRRAGEQASEGTITPVILLLKAREFFSPFLKMSVLRLPQSPLKVLQPSSKANQNLMKPQILTNCLPDSTDENQDVSSFIHSLPRNKRFLLKILSHQNASKFAIFL